MTDKKLSQLPAGTTVTDADLFYSAQSLGAGSYTQVQQPGSALKSYVLASVPAGGNVSNSGTPTVAQYARWVTATTIEGVAPATVLSDIGAQPAGSYLTTTVAAATYAPIASPTFTGDPKAPTPLTADNDTSIATTAYVQSNLSSYLTTVTAAATYAPIASPTFTGDPKAPTPATADNDTSIATTAYVQSNLANYLTTAGAAAGYQPLDGDLTSLASASATGAIYYRSAANTWATVTIGTGLTFTTGTLTVTASTYQPLDADLTSWAGVTRASGFNTFVATPSSANFAAFMTDETGTGANVFATSPTLVTPLLGTPTSGVLSNCTGLPSIVVANEAADTTCFPAFFTGATGELGPKTNANLTFNASTGSLALGGTPTAPTAAVGTSTAQIATTAFVDAEAVAKAGDTMTGNLTIAPAATSSSLILAKSASGQLDQIVCYTGTPAAATQRWLMSPGNATAESGSNAGSDFQIARYSDTGTFLSSALLIERATGIATFSATPVAPTVAAGTSTTQLATTAFVNNWAPPQRFISGAAGAVAYAATDQLITFGVTSGAGISYALPAIATRNGTALGLQIRFKDVTGCFAAHNLTITPNGAETIEGLASLVLSNNFAGVTLSPRTDGVAAWFVS